MGKRLVDLLKWSVWELDFSLISVNETQKIEKITCTL